MRWSGFSGGLVAIIAVAGMAEVMLRATKPMSVDAVSRVGSDETTSAVPARTYQGVLVNPDGQEVVAPVAARVARVLVTLGEEVEAEQALVELDAELARAEHGLAVARLGASKAQHESAVVALKASQETLAMLVALGSFEAAQQVREARRAVEARRADLAAAAANISAAKSEAARTEALLESLVLRSPAAGRIGAVLVERGAWMAEGMVAVRLAGDSPGVVRFAVPLSAGTDIAIGDTVTVEMPGWDVLSARVARSQPEYDPAVGHRLFEAVLEETGGPGRTSKMTGVPILVRHVP